jgi:hypothetical protein
MKEMELEKENPIPFVQPFLVLGFEDRQSVNDMRIDVNGEMDLYIDRYSEITSAYENFPISKRMKLPSISCLSFINFTTPKLLRIIKALDKDDNLKIQFVNWYEGSAGPNYILRNGALFKRISIDEIHEIVINSRAAKHKENFPSTTEEFIQVLLETSV